jgi:hypothetical protein
MRSIKLKAVLLVTMALIVFSGYIGVAYACFDIPGPTPPYQADLKIRDQDETWRDGVFATWMARNMAPGDNFAFNGSFVGLKYQLPRYVNTGMVDITCNYNSWSARQPDNMARYMVITKCVYFYTCMNEQWQIDCLTGKTTKVSGGPSVPMPPNSNWQIQDADRDGRITFHDLKMRPLKSVPLISGGEARFEMSVCFHKDAGNEFQNNTFNLTMFYTLTSW